MRLFLNKSITYLNDYKESKDTFNVFYPLRARMSVHVGTSLYVSETVVRTPTT